jgi:mannose-6-phosphate isomerase-like protein (cupin superfamily)
MRLTGIVDKTWGHENIHISNDLYCMKFMNFHKAGNKTSMHFHREKHETWLVIAGSFKVNVLDFSTGTVSTNTLGVNDKWMNEPLKPHQLEALEDESIIIEVSTPDSVEDNYRIYR